MLKLFPEVRHSEFSIRLWANHRALRYLSLSSKRLRIMKDAQGDAFEEIISLSSFDELTDASYDHTDPPCGLLISWKKLPRRP